MRFENEIDGPEKDVLNIPLFDSQQEAFYQWQKDNPEKTIPHIIYKNLTEEYSDKFIDLFNEDEYYHCRAEHKNHSENDFLWLERWINETKDEHPEWAELLRPDWKEYFISENMGWLLKVIPNCPYPLHFKNL